MHPDGRRGRGAVTNTSGRYEKEARVAVDDGWGGPDDEPAPLRTSVGIDTSRSIITRNQSPDIPFDRSINPYRGCEHGCIYCFARPTHAYLGLSPGIDFEAKLFMKPDAAALLEKELRAPKYKPRVIAIGTNTDPYQPIEREHRIMRQVLEVLAAFNHPVGITTKSALITRDIDILAPMAAQGLAKVYLSVTTLDRELARSMEPRAATPAKRLQAIRELTQAGIPVGCLFAPVIPGLNDHEMEAVLEAVKEAGAGEAGYLLLRLPLEIKDLFREWLSENYPNRADKVISLIRQARGGVDYVAGFGTRMVGTGPIAALIAQRFEAACKRLGLNERRYSLDASKFRPPPPVRGQLSLF
ncbi:PA0069 family radical SAM protein [Desertibaculum subflavum]|uniref:PA0069 family radical SAM protein n=1 Tax=Desertibaculum subflavum TaxID=2268458 RepID=UPI0034D2A1AC